MWEGSLHYVTPKRGGRPTHSKNWSDIFRSVNGCDILRYTRAPPGPDLVERSRSVEQLVPHPDQLSGQIRVQGLVIKALGLHAVLRITGT